jgi:hypothetical protein
MLMSSSFYDERNVPNSHGGSKFSEPLLAVEMEYIHVLSIL